jgi:hypothetical protein
MKQMVDLALDLNPGDVSLPTYKDLLVVNNDLLLTSDAYPANTQPKATNPVQQDILQRLRFFLGEWFLDNTQGVPWFQQILVKNPNQANIDAIFQNVILGTPGVIQLLSYSFTPNPEQRTLLVTFKAQTTSGVVVYSGNISPVSGG